LTDIKLPEGAVAAHPERDNALANIVAPTVMKKTDEEGTEAATGAATPEGEGA